MHIPRSQSNLVPVGTVSLRRLLRQLLLRQLTRQRIFHRYRRIRPTRDSHGLIYIRTAGQRVTNRTAQTGGSPTEGLDFRRVIMRLILEHQEPFFLLTIHIYRQYDAAGIDLVALLQVRKTALRLQSAHRRQRHIHQTLRLILSSQELPGFQIILIRSPYRSQQCPILKPDARKHGPKGRMPTMIGPVCIQHPNLRDAGIPVLCISEILLRM